MKTYKIVHMGGFLLFGELLPTSVHFCNCNLLLELESNSSFRKSCNRSVSKMGGYKLDNQDSISGRGREPDIGSICAPVL